MLSPVLSLMLQEYWKTKENTDITGDGWSAYMAALGKISESKEVACLVRRTPRMIQRSLSRNELTFL